LKLVNLGCGAHYHPDWINLDKNPLSPDVTHVDALARLPFMDSSIDAVYSSHVVEHLTSGDALVALEDVRRILKPGGLIRLVTPNLEAIVQTYLDLLHDAMDGKVQASEKYEWMILELFDQSVRERRGGEMADFLRRQDLGIQGFIKSRIGQEVEGYWNRNTSPPSLWDKVRNVNPKLLIQHVRDILAKSLVHVVAGRNAAKAFEIGALRCAGEIHYRLYDRYSLDKLLTIAGFGDIKCCRADESRIPNFNSYELDMVGKEIRKPDSLFVEAVK
jgi:predicted SAM-dependent methyltransferase